MTDSNKVTMTDGREVDFGKKGCVALVEVQKDGSIKAKVAFADGQYRDFELPVWGEDKGLNDALSQYAAAGLTEALRRVGASGKSSDFDAAAPLMAQGPAFRKPRQTALKLSPLQKALMELTGKSAEDIVAWTDAKTRKERFALSRDPRVAPILARMAAEAGKDKPDDDKPDLLAELA